MAAVSAVPTLPFREARREVQGLTAGAERRIIAWLCARMPRAVGSDHLSALGLLGTALVGVAYLLSRRDPSWLHVANLALFLNWFGDSLDGSLARFRRQERPRYGFYLDHILDAVGALFVFGGLGLSGLMSPAVAVALTVAYYLMAIHTYLATYTAGTFKISYGPLGGTELRLILMAANLAALRWPSITVAGASVRLFDELGILMAAALSAVFLVSVPRLALDLRRQETLPRA